MNFTPFQQLDDGTIYAQFFKLTIMNLNRNWWRTVGIIVLATIAKLQIALAQDNSPAGYGPVYGDQKYDGDQELAWYQTPILLVGLILFGAVAIWYFFIRKKTDGRVSAPAAPVKRYDG